MSEPEKPAEAAAPAAQTGGFVFGGTPFTAGAGFGAVGAGAAAGGAPVMLFGAKPAAAEAEEDGDGDDAAAAAEAQAECTAEFKPLVQLDDQETVTGEEDEEIAFEAKAKCYRFVSGEWKEKGTGQLKLLAHKEDKKVRLLMRREKTLKICANFRGARPELSCRRAAARRRAAR